MVPTCSTLTCSCSSARRVARSSSESELELEESALLSLLPVLLLTTAMADVPPGDEGSAGSSGILAKRISNTSYQDRVRVRQSALRMYEEIFIVHYFLPEVSLPWQQPHDQVDYIYSNLRTLTGHLLQSSGRLGTLCCPFFSGKTAQDVTKCQLISINHSNHRKKTCYIQWLYLICNLFEI